MRSRKVTLRYFINRSDGFFLPVLIIQIEQNYKPEINLRIIRWYKRKSSARRAAHKLAKDLGLEIIKEES